jgi:hypothetical protein
VLGPCFDTVMRANVSLQPLTRLKNCHAFQGLFTMFFIVDKIAARCPAILRLRKGNVAACEIPAVKAGRRAWMGIYPLHCHKYFKHKGDYRIRVFEIEEKFWNEDIGESELEVRGDVYLTGEETLLARIEEFVSPSLLGEPQGCDYPI